MTVSFVIVLKPTAEWGMNRMYAGQHWSARKRQAQQVHLLVKQALASHGAQRFTEPVRVRIAYNSRLDLDNHGYLAKLIIDGMKGILIEDDSRKFVRELVQGFHAGDCREVLVEVTDEEGELT